MGISKQGPDEMAIDQNKQKVVCFCGVLMAKDKVECGPLKEEADCCLRRVDYWGEKDAEFKEALKNPLSARIPYECYLFIYLFYCNFLFKKQFF